MLNENNCQIVPCLISSINPIDEVSGMNEKDDFTFHPMEDVFDPELEF